MSAPVGVQEKDTVDDYSRDGSCRAGGRVGNTCQEWSVVPISSAHYVIINRCN
jgi:hypothetical protein